jgi:hypothetical protein
MAVGDLRDTDYSRIVLAGDGLNVEVLNDVDNEAVLRIWHDDITPDNALEIRGIQINRLVGMLAALGFEAA